MIELIADRLDLAIDFLTLGQYGLEQAEPRDPHCVDGIRCHERDPRPRARRRGPHSGLTLAPSRRRSSRSLRG